MAASGHLKGQKTRLCVNQVLTNNNCKFYSGFIARGKYVHILTFAFDSLSKVDNLKCCGIQSPLLHALPHLSPRRQVVLVGQLESAPVDAQGLLADDVLVYRDGLV